MDVVPRRMDDRHMTLEQSMGEQPPRLRVLSGPGMRIPPGTPGLQCPRARAACGAR